MMEQTTIRIEGKVYEIFGDIFTTPDGKYDVFKINGVWAYVPVKEDEGNDLDFQSPAVKYYERAWYAFMGVGFVVLLIIFYLAFK